MSWGDCFFSSFIRCFVQVSAWRHWSTMTTLQSPSSSSLPTVGSQCSFYLLHHLHFNPRQVHSGCHSGQHPEALGLLQGSPVIFTSLTFCEFNINSFIVTIKCPRASVWKHTPGTKMRSTVSLLTSQSLVASGLFLAVRIIRWNIMGHANFMPVHSVLKWLHYLFKGVHLEPADKGNCAETSRTHWCGMRYSQQISTFW